jgi:16S rRNA (adenine1518-N6/adenine1519-N6)-dimethyltransferase
MVAIKMTENKFTLGNTRAMLEKLAHHPKKQLGQNYLIDSNILNKSLNMASVKSGDIVVEIGPGLGCLTTALLNAGAIVYAVERDSTMVGHLNELLGARQELNLLEGDGVDSPRGNMPDDTKAYKVIANLPYAISTPWLSALLEKEPYPDCMVLMLQKEAGDRFCAEPGNKNYGAISIFLGAVFEVEDSYKVSRHCFYPEPGVDSVLIHFKKKNEIIHIGRENRILIRKLFTQRRKQIGSLCKNLVADVDLQSWLDFIESKGYSHKSRPEELSPEIWYSLNKYNKPLTN